MEKITKHKKILLLWIVLLAIVGLSTGVVWGRYYKEFELQNVVFSMTNTEKYYIWQAQGEQLTPISDESFVKNGNITSLDFAVTNGESQDVFYTENQSIIPQIYISENIISSENLTINLTIDEIIYTATAEKITENTELYYSFGSGYIYSFYNENDEVYSIDLTGESYSIVTGNITITANEETLDYMMQFVLE